jgi:hypothetical protein
MTQVMTWSTVAILAFNATLLIMSLHSWNKKSSR